MRKKELPVARPGTLLNKLLGGPSFIERERIEGAPANTAGIMGALPSDERERMSASSVISSGIISHNEWKRGSGGIIGGGVIILCRFLSQ